MTQLTQAINGRRLVVVRRTADPIGSNRTVEPHVLFQTASGRTLVDVYQIAGHSESGRLPGWRALPLDELQYIAITEDKFQPRWSDGYNPDNRTKYPVVLHQASVTVLFDHLGNGVRLTDERLAHVLTHPELVGLERELERTLQLPDCVFQSLSDPSVHLYYRPYRHSTLDEKLLCVVVKFGDSDAFILTAYMTNAIKKGTELWRTS